MTTAPTDRDLASVLLRASRAVFTEKAGREHELVEREVLVVEQGDLASLREAIRLAPGPGPHCMCAGDMELTISGDRVFERITLHHGYTLRWQGAWEWSDVALADPDAFARWLAERGVTRYLAEHTETNLEHARRDLERERWIAAAPAVMRARVEAFVDDDYFARGTPDRPEVVADVAVLRAALGGDEHVALALLRWYGSGVGPWSGYPLHETVARSCLEALALSRVLPRALDALMALPLGDAALSGLARYFATVEPMRKRCRELDQLGDDLRERLEAHVRSHQGEAERTRFEALVRRARQAREQRARAKGEPAAAPLRPPDAPAILPYLPFDADRRGDNRMLFRTIDDAEYYAMVGGSADEILDVLLTPPRAGEAMSMDAGTWSRLTAALVRVGRRDPDDPRRMYRLLQDPQEMEAMDGHLGHIHRYGVLVGLAQRLGDIEPAELGDSSEERLDVAYHELRTFVVATVARRRSLHVVRASSLDPTRFPHRTRQRLARLERARRKAMRRD